MNIFQDAFKHNFYETLEFAEFCSEVTKIPLTTRTIGGKKIYTLKNKNLSISNYPEEFQALLEKEKIAHFSVLPRANKDLSDPSLFEYALIPKTAYTEAAKHYKTSFFHGLREGKKFLHEVEIVKNPDNNLISQIYAIYSVQMKRHNSFVFPESFFHTFAKCPSSLVFLIRYKGKIIAYFFCFQYYDNIYASIGGGHPNYFKYKAANKLYDEIIRYACLNNLNFHIGFGEHGSGYQQFKANAGAINYQCKRFPNDEKLLKLMFPLLKFKMTGRFLALASKTLPELIIYETMPFT